MTTQPTRANARSSSPRRCLLAIVRHTFCSVWLTLATHALIAPLVDLELAATTPRVEVTFRAVDISRLSLASGSLATSEDLLGETDR